MCTPGTPGAAAPLSFQVRPVNDGLLGVFALWAGFEVGGDRSASGSGPASAAEELRFGVALWNNVPAELADVAMEVRCAWALFVARALNHVYALHIDAG